MFKFDFGSEIEGPQEDELKEETHWHKACHFKLDEVVSLDDDSCYSLFSAGPVELKMISTSRAVFEAVSLGTESILAAESNHSDLLPGKYEGGMKTWECTRDLAEFLNTLELEWNKLNVLDLGCGTGVLGIMALLKGSKVVFQDYNEEVLRLVTGRNIILNMPQVESVSVQLFSGDWSSFRELYKRTNHGNKFNLILSSETIYNPLNYSKLHDVISELLASDGTCYLAGKRCYFGVGGSMSAFRDYTKKRKVLNVHSVWEQTEGISREIFKLTHLKQSV